MLKVYEALSNLFQQYLDDLNGSGQLEILRKATIEKIERASKVIKSELDSMDSIVAMAKRVGVEGVNDYRFPIILLCIILEPLMGF